MIHITIQDTIVDIIEKIESHPQWDIVLDIPLGHPILHNYLSLKILKSKVGKDKKLIIATSDRIGKRIGKRLGIEYSLIKDGKFIEQAENKESILQHNFTFWEYFKYQIRQYISELKNMLDTNKKLNSLGKYSRIYQEKTSLHIFVWWLVFSILLFLFVYYFAVSKSYIHISPEIIIKKEGLNFVFHEDVGSTILWDKREINTLAVSQKVNSSDVYPTTGIETKTQNTSHGTIRIYNSYEEPQELLRGSRFQTSDGVIFVTEKQLELPPALRDNFGSLQHGILDTQVSAQVKDRSGEFIGSRGNITADTTLILPALPEDQQETIYAVSQEDFTGGSDAYIKVVWEDDIDRAKALFREKLQSEWIQSIKSKLEQDNDINGTQQEILLGPNAIQYRNEDIKLIEDVAVGEQRDNFELTGSLEVIAYVFDKRDVIQKLKTIVNERHLEWVEKISYIDTDSLRMSNIVYSKEEPFEMKATFELESRFLHDFLHTENTYIEQLKSQIRGMEKEEAEKVLLNDPNISNVEIDIRPFFARKITNIPNNIIFKIK